MESAVKSGQEDLQEHLLPSLRTIVRRRLRRKRVVWGQSLALDGKASAISQGDASHRRRRDDSLVDLLANRLCDGLAQRMKIAAYFDDWETKQSKQIRMTICDVPRPPLCGSTASST